MLLKAVIYLQSPYTKLLIMKSIRIIVLLSLLLSVSFQSCKKDHGIAPDLPPESAFLADFSDFEESKAGFDKTTVNWTHSFVNVAVWSVIIVVGMAVPVASYAEAVNNREAVYQSDNTWLWEYSFPKDVNSHTAKLFGTIQEGTVDWEMYITKTGVYEDFLWYTGTSDLDGMSGTWTLFDKPTNPTEKLRIDWARTTGSTGHIKYTNIEPGGAENGGYILYGNDADSDLNAYYDIYNKGDDNLTEIEWNQTNLNGRVKDPFKFGNEEWHCWDETQQDIVCPQ